MIEPNQRHEPDALPGVDLAGSLPAFPDKPGGNLADGLPWPDFSARRLIFNHFRSPGEVHVYVAEATAGQRVRAQLFVPVLPWGGAVVPSFALVAQSLPYSADVYKLPLELPGGYSAIVTPPPAELLQPVQDLLTSVQYYPGPVIDTRTLVGGRCYLLVWSPHNQMGKYVLQTGHRWPWRWTYWLQLPRFWWQIRGWFGLGRSAAYFAVVGLILGLLILIFSRKKTAHQAQRAEEESAAG